VLLLAVLLLYALFAADSAVVCALVRVLILAVSFTGVPPFVGEMAASFYLPILSVLFWRWISLGRVRITVRSPSVSLQLAGSQGASSKYCSTSRRGIIPRNGKRCSRGIISANFIVELSSAAALGLADRRGCPSYPEKSAPRRAAPKIDRRAVKQQFTEL
jgi:hypothetical protein